MGDKKLIKILKWALAGPILGWALFISFSVGFPKSGNSVFFALKMTATSYFVALIIVGLCLYTSKERKIDRLLGNKSSVDDASFDLLHAIDHQLEPDDAFTPKHTINIAMQILQNEIEKAISAGADNAMIAEYLQQEIDSWIEGTLKVASDFEIYTHIIDELNQ